MTSRCDIQHAMRLFPPPHLPPHLLHSPMRSLTRFHHIHLSCPPITRLNDSIISTRLFRLYTTYVCNISTGFLDTAPSLSQHYENRLRLVLGSFTVVQKG